MTLYEGKPQQVEAIQWLGDNFNEVQRTMYGKVRLDGFDLSLRAGKDGAQDWVPVPVGHWLVHLPNDRSDVWPVDPDYFAEKYTESVEP